MLARRSCCDASRSVGSSAPLRRRSTSASDNSRTSEKSTSGKGPSGIRSYSSSASTASSKRIAASRATSAGVPPKPARPSRCAALARSHGSAPDGWNLRSDASTTPNTSRTDYPDEKTYGPTEKFCHKGDCGIVNCELWIVNLNVLQSAIINPQSEIVLIYSHLKRFAATR